MEEAQSDSSISGNTNYGIIDVGTGKNASSIVGRGGVNFILSNSTTVLVGIDASKSNIIFIEPPKTNTNTGANANTETVTIIGSGRTGASTLEYLQISGQSIVDEDRYLVKKFLDEMIGILKEEKKEHLRSLKFAGLIVLFKYILI